MIGSSSLFFSSYSYNSEGKEGLISSSSSFFFLILQPSPICSASVSSRVSDVGWVDLEKKSTEADVIAAATI